MRLTLKIILAHGQWWNKDVKRKFKWLQRSKKGKFHWDQGNPNTCLGLFPLLPKELCCSLQEYWEATDVALSGAKWCHKLWLSVVQWWEGWSDVDKRQQKMGSMLDVVLCLCHWEYLRCEWVNRITPIWVLFRIGTAFITSKEQVSHWICDWESFASEECSEVKAVRARCPYSRWLRNFVVCCCAALNSWLV